MTNSSPTDITGVNSTYSLATDGTATTITAVSTDPEGFPLTWSYATTTGSLGSTATVSQADNVFTITPSTTAADAGTFSITFSVTDGATGAVNAVSAFSLGFGYDLNGASYDNLSFSVASQATWPYGMTFSTDGTKLFVIGLSQDKIFQYSLTNAFSLASGNVTYDNISLDISSQTQLASGLAFSTDGTKMFLVGYQYSRIHQYSLTTGFSLAAGNVTIDNLGHSGNTYLDISATTTGTQDFAFSTDGTKMFLLESTTANPAMVRQFSMTNAFSLASGNVTNDNLSFDATSQITGVSGSGTKVTDLVFKPDGTKMFILEGNPGKVYQYSLTNAFSLASGNVTYDNISFSVSSQESDAQGLAFNSNGNKMFVIGKNTDAVYQYTTGV